VVAGDSDYVGALQAVKANGKKILKLLYLARKKLPDR
jgi:hypothetical protein